MNERRVLTLIFALILLNMLLITGWASWVQPVWKWTGLRQHPDHAWTIATLFDAYYGFLTFYIWVFYKERRWSGRVIWFVVIMTLGNMAMASYMLKELWKLRGPVGPDADIMARLLTQRN